MWPFPKRRQAVDEAHLELIRQIAGLTNDVKQLRDDLASLEDKHERLRGKFYGSRRGALADGQLPSKAEALQAFLNKQR